MISSKHRPQWWQLYLAFPLLIFLFAADGRLKISSRGHQIVQIAIVLLIFGLIHLWIRANSVALSRMDREEYYGRTTVIRIPSYQETSMETENRTKPEPLIPEIKGVLSDTFELNYMDVRFVPLESNSQALEKN